MALHPEREALKAEYPELEDEDIAQALEFAALNLDDQILPLDDWHRTCEPEVFLGSQYVGGSQVTRYRSMMSALPR